MKKLVIAALALALLLTACGTRAMSDDIPVDVDASGIITEATEAASDAALDFSLPDLPVSSPSAEQAVPSEAAQITTAATTAQNTGSGKATSPASAASTPAAATTKASASASATTTKANASSSTAATTTRAGASSSTATTTRASMSSSASTTISTTAAPPPKTTTTAPPPGPITIVVPADYEGSKTVLDFLLDTVGASNVKYRGSGTTTYVFAINGVKEFDYGGSSGWKYEVNGSYPPKSCGVFQPKAGDVIVWRYVL